MTEPGLPAISALDDLRAVRRHRRIGNVAWGDLAYRVYTTALGAIVVVIFASGLIGDSHLDQSAVQRLSLWGPRWAGLTLGALLVLGARSGSRGGPVALEAADVHNLLLAPLPRSRVLRRPAAGTLGYGCAGAAAAGALVGLLMAQRVPGGNAGFISSGILFGASAAAGAYGIGFLTASRRLPAPLVVATTVVLSALSIAEIAGLIGWSPLSEAGKVLLWPLHFTPLSIIALFVLWAVAFTGMMWIGGLSVEAAQRRTRLVGQLRFAVTQQDLRSVLLLRRQLASEHPIRRSRLRGAARMIGRRFPVFGRGLASIGRWPAVRVLRVLVLSILAAFAARGVWGGTTPLVVVCGLCTYIAALDAIEPLAQEIDHPLLVDSYPETRGVMFQKHLVAPVLVMLVSGAVGALAALAPGASSRAVEVAVITTFTAALSAVAGAAVSVVGEAILSAVDEAMLPPEVAGPRVVMRTVWPPLVAVLGFTPLIAAQRVLRNGGDLSQVLLWTSAIPVVISAAVFVWVRYRDDLHDTMNEAMGR